MKIKEHINILIDKYDLRSLYNKYIFISILSTIIYESFYWTLIFFNNMLIHNPTMIKQYVGYLFILYFLNIPLKKIFYNIKIELVTKLDDANNKYFNNRIINISKKELLNFDLNKYYDILLTTKIDIFNYISALHFKYNIPIKCITLLVVAINQKSWIIFSLLPFFYIIINNLYAKTEKESNKLIVNEYEIKEHIKKYIINSKTFLINNDFNESFINKKISDYLNFNKNIYELDINLNMKTNILIIIFILIVLKNNINNLKVENFIVYMMIIYDITFITDALTEYYDRKQYYRSSNIKLKFLYSFVPVINNITYEPINQITINYIYNEEPYININKQIIINNNDHILIDGDSGSGKTSFLYIIKGIIDAKIINIEPNIKHINNNSYITLPNHKSIYNGNLYDIITNYEENPNYDLINASIKISKIDKILNENTIIDIEKISSGERIRLLIARLIYTIKNKNYKILLFDEIDENLNDNLAIEICKNIREIFNDKIILYISHNRKVKELFNKKIKLENGSI